MKTKLNKKNNIDKPNHLNHPNVSKCVRYYALRLTQMLMNGVLTMWVQHQVVYQWVLY